MMVSTLYSASPDAALSLPTIVSSTQPPLKPSGIATAPAPNSSTHYEHTLSYAMGFLCQSTLYFDTTAATKFLVLTVGSHLWCGSSVLPAPPSLPLQMTSLRNACPRFLSTVTNYLHLYCRPQRQSPVLVSSHFSFSLIPSS